MNSRRVLRAGVILFSLIDFVFLVAISFLWVKQQLQQEGIPFEQWWKNHVVNYRYEITLFDLFIVGVIRSFGLFIVISDCCCFMRSCWKSRNDKGSQSMNSKTSISRILGFILVGAIVLLNLPFLITKAIFYVNDPFSRFPLVLIYSSIGFSIVEVSLFLPLLFSKRRDHDDRYSLEKRPLLPPVGGDEEEDREYRSANEGSVSSNESKFQTPTNRTPRSSFRSARESVEGGGETRSRLNTSTTFYSIENLNSSEFFTPPSSSYFTPQTSPQSTDFFTPQSSGFFTPRSSSFFTPQTSPNASRTKLDFEEEEEEEKQENVSNITQFVNLFKNTIGIQDLDTIKFPFPSWIYEGDSTLERMVFLSYPQLFSQIGDKENSVQRILAVTKLFFANLQIFKNVSKKPFNPILGEQFICVWENSPVQCFAEQVSHHPPVSVFHYQDVSRRLYYTGEIKGAISFTGSSFKMDFEGTQKIEIRNPKGVNYNVEEYVITMPTYYLGGFLIGKMTSSFSGECKIFCKQNGSTVVINFLEKPLIGGRHRKIEGKIFDGEGELSFLLSGYWDSRIDLLDNRSQQNGVLFDVAAENPEPFVVEEISNQNDLESRKVWFPVYSAIRNEDWGKATEERQKIEEYQRRFIHETQTGKVNPYTPHFFTKKSDPKNKNQSQRNLQEPPWVFTQEQVLQDCWFSHFKE